VVFLLALASPEIELLGVSTVAGNKTCDKTYSNALRTLTLLGRKDVPVTKGEKRPLLRELTIAPTIHSVSGLDGADLPEPGFEGDSRHAVDFIIETIMGPREPVTLVPTGPLTNVALALLKEPGLARVVSRIVLMGGAVHNSNINPAAESNIFVDPKATKIVFGRRADCHNGSGCHRQGAALSFVDIDEMES
jgi:inosine-uridine nucleoside N-ribohydrolase